MARKKINYVCMECGFSSPKWLGKCPECGTWDSLQEEVIGGNSNDLMTSMVSAMDVQTMAAIDLNAGQPIPTGMEEFDRVLGGGLVPGAVILLAGAPGIGKTTLLTHTLMNLAQKGHRVLYVSGEESASQIARRAKRIGHLSDRLLLACNSDARAIVQGIRETRPGVVAIDSIQTMHLPDVPGVPGSMSQVRHTSSMLMDLFKELQIPAFIVGHVTKQGGIAGPMVLEHMVDTVLSFEGDRSHQFRILRAVKNRYGSVSEIGIFEMTGSGLVQVSNPSKLFIDQNPGEKAGSVITVCLEGSRPLLVEIQALVTQSYLANPRRTTAGIDSNRLALLSAVAERHLGVGLFDRDIFVNVVGGFRISEPAADLPTLMAVCSSLLSRPLGMQTAVMGEVGLTGEIRPVPQLSRRIKEALRLGFNRCIVPVSGKEELKQISGLELVPVAWLQDAVDCLEGR